MDSKSINFLFRKFKQSFLTNQLEAEHKADFASTGISLVFCFIVIEKEICLIKHFDYDTSKSLSAYTDQFFDFDYKILDKKVEVEDAKGWKIIQNEF